MMIVNFRLTRSWSWGSDTNWFALLSVFVNDSYDDDVGWWWKHSIGQRDEVVSCLWDVLLYETTRYLVADDIFTINSGRRLPWKKEVPRTQRDQTNRCDLLRGNRSGRCCWKNNIISKFFSVLKWRLPGTAVVVGSGVVETTTIGPAKRENDSLKKNVKAQSF